MTSIVDTPPTAAASSDDGDGRDLIESIYQRILDQSARFFGVLAGVEWYSAYALALVVHEIVTDHTATVVAEVGTADGEVRDLVDLLVAKLEDNDRLRDENERLRAELADDDGREPVT